MVKHKQEEYQYESFEECDVERCKDANGKWTKWVPERMTDEQRQVYGRVREWLEAMGWEYLSVNFVLRYCDG